MHASSKKNILYFFQNTIKSWGIEFKSHVPKIDNGHYLTLLVMSAKVCELRAVDSKEF